MPDAPGYVRSVIVPPAVGRSAYVVAAERGDALQQANGIITRFRSWYQDVKARFGSRKE